MKAPEKYWTCSFFVLFTLTLENPARRNATSSVPPFPQPHPSRRIKSGSRNDGLFLADEDLGKLMGRFGRLMVSSCTLFGDNRILFLMRTLCCALERQRFGLRTFSRLLTHSRCLMWLSFAALYLSATNVRLAFLTASTVSV